MRNRILFLFTLFVAPTLLASSALGQEQADAITKINGETLTTCLLYTSDAADELRSV